MAIDCLTKPLKEGTAQGKPGDVRIERRNKRTLRRVEVLRICCVSVAIRRLVCLSCTEDS